MDLIRDMAYQNNSILIALTESHLKAEITNAEVNFDGYHLLRADRSEGCLKGGVIVYIKDNLVGELTVLSSGSNDVVEWISLHLERQNIAFLCIYRPPFCHSNKFEQALNQFNEDIEKLGTPSPTIFMCGDFNLPIIKWIDYACISVGTLDMQAQAGKLKDLASMHFLEQLVHENTRQQNILDLVFS